MSEHHKNNLFFWGKIVGITVGILTCASVVSGMTYGVMRVYTNSVILENNQRAISDRQVKVIERLDENDQWKKDRIVADTKYAAGAEWMTKTILKHEQRLNRLDIAHKFYDQLNTIPKIQ